MAANGWTAEQASSYRFGCSRGCFGGCSCKGLVQAFEAGQLEFFASLESLRDRTAFLAHLAPLHEAEWVVYAKRPFAGPEQVARLRRALYPPGGPLQQPAA